MKIEVARAFNPRVCDNCESIIGVQEKRPTPEYCADCKPWVADQARIHAMMETCLARNDEAIAQLQRIKADRAVAIERAIQVN